MLWAFLNCSISCLCLCSDLALYSWMCSVWDFQHHFLLCLSSSLLLLLLFWHCSFLPAVITFGLVISMEKARYTFATCNVTHNAQQCKRPALLPTCTVQRTHMCVCNRALSALVLFCIRQTQAATTRKESNEYIYCMSNLKRIAECIGTHIHIACIWMASNQQDQQILYAHPYSFVVAQTQTLQDGCTNKQIYSNIIWLLHRSTLAQDQ